MQNATRETSKKKCQVCWNGSNNCWNHQHCTEKTVVRGTPGREDNRWAQFFGQSNRSQVSLTCATDKEDVRGGELGVRDVCLRCLRFPGGIGVEGYWDQGQSTEDGAELLLRGAGQLTVQGLWWDLFVINNHIHNFFLIGSYSHQL